MRDAGTFVCHVCARDFPALAVLVRGRSPLCGAGLAQMAVEGVEVPDGLLLALGQCLEEVLFVER